MDYQTPDTRQLSLAKQYPDGPGKVKEVGRPRVRVVQGALMSRVEVGTQY